MTLDRVNSMLWGIAGLITLITGAIKDDAQIVTIGVLAFILSYIIKLCVLSEESE